MSRGYGVEGWQAGTGAEAGGQDTSVILIKPDGYRSEPLRGMLADCLEAGGLTVTSRKIVELRRDGILGIWPVFAQGDHPVMREMYCQYIGSGPCEVLLVQGPQALTAALGIKSRIRKAFEVCAFENAIHCPADAVERTANLAHLVGGVTALPDPAWPEWAKQGRFGPASRVSIDEIAGLARTIWQERVAGGWPQVFSRGLHRHHDAYRAALRPGDPNSIDYGISALFDILRPSSFAFCVRAYIEAEVMRWAIIASGTHDEMLAIQTAFAAHGMTVDVAPAPR